MALSNRIYNEQTKLVAYFLSNLGITVFTAGFLTPLFNSGVKMSVAAPIGGLLGGLLLVGGLQALKYMEAE